MHYWWWWWWWWWWWCYVISWWVCWISTQTLWHHVCLATSVCKSLQSVIHIKILKLLLYCNLYLISKCVYMSGRNRVTWRSLNRNIALARHYCLHKYSRMSILPSLIICVSLILLNNSWNHSTDKSKSQFFTSFVYLSSKYRIFFMKLTDS